jgi:hypothetical protein
MCGEGAVGSFVCELTSLYKHVDIVNAKNGFEQQIDKATGLDSRVLPQSGRRHPAGLDKLNMVI